MSLSTQNRKRKAVTRDAQEPAAAATLDAELGNGVLDGILSESEGESENSDYESDMEEGDDSGEEDEDDEDDEEELDSDEIPSEDDEADIRDQIRNLKTGSAPTNGTATGNGRSADFTKAPTNTLTNGASGAEGEDNDEELRPNYTVTQDANGNPRYIYREIDPVYDSDDSDAPQTTNTIGNIPLTYYDSYPHIGYDVNGKKIMRPAKGEALDALLDSIDLPEGWTGLTDPATGKPLELSKEELDVLKRITRNEAPGEGYDPYPDMVEYFTSKTEIMPLSAAPEPKRRFVPSKHEAKRVMKIVRAIKEGRIQPYRRPEEREEQENPDVKRYDIWADEAPRPDHPMNVPAPKLPPPGYAESYHPPPEYLPDQQERKAWEDADEEDRDTDFLPTDHTALRKVPGYERFIKEKFERCLDLYLAPRVRRSKLNIDPESLLPKLPSPDELRPFPTVCATLYRGHQGRVRSVSVDPTGVFVASGGDDGTVRVWDLLSGRELYRVRLSPDEAVNAVRWRPSRDGMIIGAAAGETMYFIIPLDFCSPDLEESSRTILDAGFGYAANSTTTSTQDVRKPPAATWARPGAKLAEKGVLLSCTVRSTIKVIHWHRRGDYFSTVSPSGASQAIAIHTLSKHLTQHPFRRLRGLAQTCSFHPSKPLFFVATRQSIRLYDLQAQRLEKELKPGARWISSIDVHPGGDNLLVGSYDRRLLWHDLDLANTPYKTLRYHQKAIRSVRYHPNAGQYPLFADASDDGSVQIFHGKVVGDSLENATIVPLKVLKGHKVTGELGVLDVEWHPREPWCLSAGADGTIRLWC
ncbi:Ribosome biogenesis protein erb1 [Taxawa tesnikishii (nom. ined.)]|nr:Ribosome biogenesis protein erb1 [Dothideales sp. JES 119]